LLPCTGDPNLLLADANVIFLVVSDIQHDYILHSTFSPTRHPHPSGIYFFFKYLRHKLIAALGVYTECNLLSSYRQRICDTQTQNMDFSKRFEEATSSTTVSIRSMEVNKMYPIFHAKRINTKFGSTVLLSIRDSEAKIVQIFLPKRYGDVSDDDMVRINSKTVSINLIFKGICDTSKSLLAIVS